MEIGKGSRQLQFQNEGIRFLLPILAAVPLYFGSVQGFLYLVKVVFKYKGMNDSNLAMIYCIPFVVHISLIVYGKIAENRYNQSLIERKEDPSDESLMLEFKSSAWFMFKTKISRFLLTLGLYPLRDFIFDRYTKFADIFIKPSYWDNFPENHSAKIIVRCRVMKTNLRVEIRYKKWAKAMLVRSVSDESVSLAYDDWKEVSPFEYKFMLFAFPDGTALGPFYAIGMWLFCSIRHYLNI